MRGNSQEPKPGPIHESGTIHERPIHERALYSKLELDCGASRGSVVILFMNI